MSELIKYLNNVENPNSITEDLGVKVKEYEGGLFVFNYSQIDSPKTNEVVRECRGSILYEDADLGWQFICRPFKRFFNYGEAPDTLDNFDFKRAEVLEKADGSLIKLYWHKGQWHIATRGTAYAESENYTGAVFRDLVLDAFGFSEEEFLTRVESYLPRHITHLYEFTSPDNRVVTPYDKPEMVYLGSVDNDTGSVDYIDTCAFLGNARAAESFNLDSIESCVEASKTLGDLKEGFVVRDMQSGQMVKIKSPLYVAAHHLRGELGLTPKKIAKLVVTNETDEYLKYFPEDSGKIRLYSDQWEIIQGFIENVWQSKKSIESMKDFAMEVKDLPYSSVLFLAKRSKDDSNPINHLNNSTDKFKIDLLLNWKENLK